MIKIIKKSQNFKKNISDNFSIFVLPDWNLGSENNINIELDIIWTKSQINIFLFVWNLENIKNNINLTSNIISDNIKCRINTVCMINQNSFCDNKCILHIPKTNNNSDAYLLQENIFLWDGKIRSLPILDINTNKSIAEHWALIQKLNTESLFYINSRWISEALAKKIFIESYIKKCLWDSENTRYFKKIFSLMGGELL